MRRPWPALLLGALLAWTGPSWAQEAASEGTQGRKTVTREEVKTWTATIEGKEFSVRPATPSYDGDTGLFHLSSAYTLPRGKAAFSLFRDNLDRDPKDIDFSIHGLNVAYGATDRLEIFGSVGLQNRIDTDALSQPGFANDYPFAGTHPTAPGWQTGFGDIKLGAKIKLLDDYLGDGVGLAIKGVVKLPTADEALGLGTGKVSFGGDLILSKTLNYGADIHGSIGFVANSDPDNRDIGNAIRWGLGLNVPSCRYFQLHAEVVGTNYTGDDAFPQTNPVDLVVGPVVWIKPGFFVRPAISWNLNFDDRGLNSGTASKTGRQISIGYHPGTACCEVYTPPPPPPPPANRPPTVQCEVEKSTLVPGETTRCRATGSDPDGDALTYSWSASAGSVTGSGAEATYDSSGVASGTEVTITVTADDGRGGRATATCKVRVKEEPKPEPITCTSGGFPRNLSRLNNVDKACLDDVAARLRQDPGSRVIIVGHADSRERYPEVIGRKRAEEVKKYLVTERGIDEARISTRSAGDTRPLDTGTTSAARAKNRRVEVIFVPTGATAPEYDD